MIQIIQEEVALLGCDYLMSQAEYDEFTEKVREDMTVAMLREMYAQEDRKKFATDKFEPYCEELVKARPPVTPPGEQAVMRHVAEMIAKANEEAAVESSKGYMPNFVLVMGPVDLAKEAESGASVTAQDVANFELRNGAVTGISSAAANAYSMLFSKKS